MTIWEYIIEEFNGEQSYIHKYQVLAKTFKEANAFAQRVIENFFHDGNWDEENERWETPGGDLAWRLYSVQEFVSQSIPFLEDGQLAGYASTTLEVGELFRPPSNPLINPNLD